MKRIVFAVTMFFLVTVILLFAADQDTVPIPADAKCPVCGMFVAKYPDWTAKVRFKDGTTSYYDGPKDMFTHYLDTARYTREKQQADILVLEVKEYYTLTMIDARTAIFVTGSDVCGPMGNELIPFKTEKEALGFKLDHGGKSLLKFNEISLQTIKALD